MNVCWALETCSALLASHVPTSIVSQMRQGHAPDPPAAIGSLASQMALWKLAGLEGPRPFSSQACQSSSVCVGVACPWEYYAHVLGHDPVRDLKNIQHIQRSWVSYCKEHDTRRFTFVNILYVQQIDCTNSVQSNIVTEFFSGDQQKFNINAKCIHYLHLHLSSLLFFMHFYY